MNDKSMYKKLAFSWGDENKIRIAKAGEKDSFFYEAYRKALAGVTEIVNTSNRYQETASGKQQSCYFDPSKDSYNYPNNIIVFTGERGAGKSSAMLTFADGLQNEDSLLFKNDFLQDMLAHNFPYSDLDTVASTLKSCFFLPLAPIDPTAMEKDGQILTILLARMYRMAKQCWEKRDSELASTEKTELLNQFDACYQHVCIMKRLVPCENEMEGLEGLSRLGDSTHLKEELMSLVKKFLKFCSASSAQHCQNHQFLVIQLDDTDMNIEHAYEIMEDVRRYLMIPQVIIIMAADVRHLSTVVQNSFSQFYKGDVYKRSEMTHQMAQQYVVKLIPRNRQVELSSLNRDLQEHADRVELTYEIGDAPILPDDCRIKHMQAQLCRLIYRKTGMMFLCDSKHPHPIIPSNIRLLSHLLAVLGPMQDVILSDGSPNFFLKGKVSPQKRVQHIQLLKTRMQNIQQFREFFMNTWAEYEFTAQQLDQLWQLDQASIDQKLRLCIEIINPETDDPSKKCTYGDVMYALHVWGEKNSNNQKLEQAIHICLSFSTHAIILEDLIDYYETNGKYGCFFGHLYHLFGSFPFHHRNNSLCVGKIKTRRIFGADKGISLYTIWTCDLPDESKMTWLELRYLNFACSLFLDIQAATSTKLTADLSAVFANCLYLTTDRTSSRITTLLTGDEGILREGTIHLETMQEISLVILSNWDLHCRLQRKITSIEHSGSNLPLPAQNFTDTLQNVSIYFKYLMLDIWDEADNYIFPYLNKMSFDDEILSLLNQLLASIQASSEDNMVRFQQFFTLAQAPAHELMNESETISENTPDEK